MLVAPFTDVRVERPRMNWNWIEGLPGLKSINLAPPASGPEIELTFGTAEGSEPVEVEFLLREVERLTHRSVLAWRRRGNSSAESFAVPGEELRS